MFMHGHLEGAIFLINVVFERARQLGFTADGYRGARRNPDCKVLTDIGGTI